MRCAGRWLEVVVFAAIFATASRGVTQPWPTVEGEVTGKFTLLEIAGGPTLDWKLTLREESSDERVAEFTAKRPGTEIRAEVRLDAAGNGSWQLIEAQADLASWAPLVAVRLGRDYAGLILEGRTRAEGKGTWRERKIDGRLYFSVEAERLELPAQKISLRGVSLELLMEDVGAFRSAPAQMISWAGGTYDVYPIERGRIMFTLDGDSVQVDEGVVGFLGGEVTLAPFTFSRSKPEMTFIARASGIDVKLLLPLFSEVLADAEGRLDGTLTFRQGADGLTLSAGQLSLQRGGNARMRLAPKPGLITDRVPSRVLEQLPALKKIETGEVPLTAERFDVSFNAAGDGEGRNAVIHMIAGPDDPSLRAPVHLTVNVRGPIDRLLRSAANTNVQFGGSR